MIFSFLLKYTILIHVTISYCYNTITILPNHGSDILPDKTKEENKENHERMVLEELASNSKDLDTSLLTPRNIDGITRYSKSETHCKYR